MGFTRATKLAEISNQNMMIYDRSVFFSFNIVVAIFDT